MRVYRNVNRDMLAYIIIGRGMLTRQYAANSKKIKLQMLVSDGKRNYEMN